jgi:hypothetical protein
MKIEQFNGCSMKPTIDLLHIIVVITVLLSGNCDY